MNHISSSKWAVLVTWIVLLASVAESKALPKSAALEAGLPSPSATESSDATDWKVKFPAAPIGAMTETLAGANPVAAAVASSEVLNLAKSPRRSLGRNEFWTYSTYNPAEIVRNRPSRWKLGISAASVDSIWSAAPALGSVSVPEWLSTSQALAFGAALVVLARLGLGRRQAAEH